MGVHHNWKLLNHIGTCWNVGSWGYCCNNRFWSAQFVRYVENEILSWGQFHCVCRRRQFGVFFFFLINWYRQYVFACFTCCTDRFYPSLTIMLTAKLAEQLRWCNCFVHLGLDCWWFENDLCANIIKTEKSTYTHTDTQRQTNHLKWMRSNCMQLPMIYYWLDGCMNEIKWAIMRCVNS